MGGGGADAADDGSGVCATSPAQSQCTQCANADCCSDLANCASSPSCENLVACIDRCTTSTCATTCEQQYSGAASTTFQELTACLAARCAVCSQLGVGDPCGASATTCNPGLTCGGLWCTRACAKASDCAGLGANGGNFTGQPNACRQVATGDVCFPGCAGDADCASFPGTYCLVTTAIDGTTVQVCAAAPDAGTE